MQYWRRLQRLPVYERLENILPPASTLLNPSQSPHPLQPIWVISFRFLLNNRGYLASTAFGQGQATEGGPLLIFSALDNLFLNKMSAEGSESARGSLSLITSMNIAAPESSHSAREGMKPRYIF